jgi:hypothetical protein
MGISMEFNVIMSTTEMLDWKLSRVYVKGDQKCAECLVYARKITSCCNKSFEKDDATDDHILLEKGTNTLEWS